MKEGLPDFTTTVPLNRPSRAPVATATSAASHTFMPPWLISTP